MLPPQRKHRSKIGRSEKRELHEIALTYVHLKPSIYPIACPNVGQRDKSTPDGSQPSDRVR